VVRSVKGLRVPTWAMSARMAKSCGSGPVGGAKSISISGRTAVGGSVSNESSYYGERLIGCI
jgi:hypothetical protein